jgi:hypothetical protein
MVKVSVRFGGTYRRHLQGRRVSQGRNQHEAGSKQSRSMPVSFFAFSSTLKMGAICSSETSVDFHLTTWRYIPEDNSLLSIILVSSLLSLF